MKKDTRTYLRGFVGVGDVIGGVTDRIFKKKGFVQSQLYTKWPEIVGEDLANKMSPGRVFFRRGEKTDGTLQLIVYGSDSLEIMHMNGVILERLAVYFGYKAVTKLKIIQKPMRVVAETEQLPIIEKNVANKADQITIDSDLVKNIKDDELRQVLMRLSSSVK